MNEFLLRVDVLPWDSAAAQQYGHLRAALEREGQAIGNLDTMIGAHALAVGAVLVTNDHAFRRIRKLKVEDWTKGPQQRGNQANRGTETSGASEPSPKHLGL